MSSHAIWKYPIHITDTQAVSLPRGARIIACQAQGTVLFLWAIVDTTAGTEKRTIRIHGTGHPIDPECLGVHLGTVQLDGLVWYCFEEFRIQRS